MLYIPLDKERYRNKSFIIISRISIENRLFYPICQINNYILCINIISKYRLISQRIAFIIVPHTEVTIKKVNNLTAYAFTTCIIPSDCNFVYNKKTNLNVVFLTFIYYSFFHRTEHIDNILNIE
jgi:hypothetical protein